ncbi:synaptobrevin-like protein [Collybia nuda]|uniref:Synaptobrevin-like protein n=1 Tax=Collybia nuda TaxID=64659 RepID=A0A9P5YAX7_9AGAR|nr:synaptobrevin-like protein [Collybia nuda]
MMPEPYDPYYPRSAPAPSLSDPGPSRGPSNNPRIANIQAQIDNTVEIMKDNITKVAERGERLESLEARTETLAVSARGFRRTANRVRKNMWWQDMKMRIIIGVTVAVIISLVVLSIVQATRKKK